MALILEVLERAFDSKVQISEMFTNCTAQIFVGAPPPYLCFTVRFWQKQDVKR